MSKIKYLIIKEFRQIRRDRAMRGILIGMPILQLLLLGYVVSSDVRNIRTVLCDLDQTSLSRSLCDKIVHSPYFNVASIEPTTANTDKLLDSGKASVVVIFPEDFSRRIKRGEKAQIQILMDGQDVNTATIALGYLNGIFEHFAVLEILSKRIAGNAEALPKIIEPNFRIWYNEE
ncbi:MAG: ABC transporter permease, partial [Calditrichaeota bacterium]